jgi:hypothetical protein
MGFPINVAVGDRLAPELALALGQSVAVRAI